MARDEIVRDETAINVRIAYIQARTDLPEHDKNLMIYMLQWVLG